MAMKGKHVTECKRYNFIYNLGICFAQEEKKMTKRLSAESTSGQRVEPRNFLTYTSRVSYLTTNINDEHFPCCIWIHIWSKGARIVTSRAAPESKHFKRVTVLCRGINITPVLEDWRALKRTHNLILTLSGTKYRVSYSGRILSCI